MQNHSDSSLNSTSWTTANLVSSSLMGLCFMVGVPGNIAVIFFIVRHFKKDNFFVQLMLNLAAADILCLITLPVWIYNQLYSWSIGQSSCKFFSILIYISAYSSLITVTMLSVYRCLQIRHPQLWSRMSKRKERLLLIGGWALALLFSFPGVLTQEIIQSKSKKSCGRILYSEEYRLTVATLEMLLAFFLPFTIILTSYCCLHKKATQGVFSHRFFVVEDHILHATQGLVTRAFTDELWNMALSKIIAVLRTHSSYCNDPDLVLELKNLIVIFADTLQGYGFPVNRLFDLLFEVRDQYNETLLKKWALVFRDIFEQDNYSPIPVENEEEYKAVVSRFPFHDAEIEKQQFPKKLPMSQSVPQIYSQVKEFIYASLKFSESLHRSSTEIDDMLRKSTNLLLTRTLSSCLQNLIKKPHIGLTELVQIIINTTHLEHACKYLEDFITNITNVSPETVHTTRLYGLSTFKDARHAAEGEIYTKLNQKIDEFIQLADYEWGMSESDGRASGYLMDLINFLRSTFQVFTHLPNNNNDHAAMSGWIANVRGGSFSSQGNHIKSSCSLVAFNTDQAGGGMVGLSSVNAASDGKWTVTQISCHADLLTDLDFSPFDDYLLATCSADETVKLWRVCDPDQDQPSNPEVTLSPADGRLEIVLFHPSASGLLAVASAKGIQVWDVTRDAALTVLEQHADQLQGLAWKEDGSLLASSCKYDSHQARLSMAAKLQSPSY
ncbi:uncharacterized protein [Garra rufa]|uniref:uncharacterized protein n=1 Tax=Garra rufa TaxID=137080 RepID=UPI003CCEBC5C